MINRHLNSTRESSGPLCRGDYVHLVPYPNTVVSFKHVQIRLPWKRGAPPGSEEHHLHDLYVEGTVPHF